LDEIAAAFVSFMNKVPFYGAVVACVDPPWRERLQKLRPQLRRRVVTYGIEAGADVTARALELKPAGASFEVEARGKSLGCFETRVVGRHNVQNALATVAVGLELDLTADQIRTGLRDFRGADRRFQVKAEAQGITVVDDYGHHPTEIRATLEAAALRGARRIWAIFQPHRYTRTRALMDDFAHCFERCDRVYVLDIYPASEQPIPGITSERLIERMHELGFERARYAPSSATVVQEVLAEMRPGDLILTVGAGSVWQIAEALGEAVREQASSAEERARQAQ
jgi:UDP-N-acetylmuramate--alanine ligase